LFLGALQDKLIKNKNEIVAIYIDLENRKKICCIAKSYNNVLKTDCLATSYISH